MLTNDFQMIILDSDLSDSVAVIVKFLKFTSSSMDLKASLIDLIWSRAAVFRLPYQEDK